MFDIHRVKPVHGWREFIGEVGIIVLGILLALAAEQVIERFHWRREVGHVRDTLRSDLSDLLVNAKEREIEDGCIRRRLNLLLSNLNSGNGKIAAVGHIGAPALRTWQLASWPAAVSSQVTTHLDRDEMLTLANLQAQGFEAEENAGREMDDWAGLYSMVGPARPLDGGETSNLRRLIADAAYRANLLRLDAYQVDQTINGSGILTVADKRMAMANLQKVLSGPNRQSLCGVIPPPLSNTADAPYDPRVQPNPLHGFQTHS